MSKPRRSSMKYLPELIEYEGNSVLEKTLQRRVSFANVISICGATEGITQLPLSKCSEDSTECTKSNVFVLSDISSTSDVSMNICSDTSLQNSPQFCKPAAVSIPTNDPLKQAYSNRLSTTMDVSMSDASSVAPVSSTKLQPPIAILGIEFAETSDVSMAIDDECSVGGNHPVWKASESIPVVSTYHSVSPVSTTIDVPGSQMLGVTERFAEDSLHLTKSRDVDLPVEYEVITAQSNPVPTSCPSNAPSTPPAHQTPSQITVCTPKTKKTPILEMVPSSSHSASVHAHVWSIPPLKSDQCLWNSVPGRRRKKRALLTQSATRWHYRLQQRGYISDEGDDETDQPKANADHRLTGSHSISLNNTPIRRIGPRIDWFEAAKEHNSDMSTSLLKVRRHKAACLRSESANLARDLMKLNRLPFQGITTTAFNTQISPLLNLKNLPLSTVAFELEDLCGVPPIFSELDGVLDKLSEIKKMKIDRATWWVRSCNLRSRADSLTGSDSLLHYSKLCLDRQKAVLESCQAAKLDDKLDVTDCYGAAMETLKRCTSETARELMQLNKDRCVTRQAHLHGQIEFLRQLDAQLAEECEQLKQELTCVNSEISEWEQLTLDDKENVAGVISDLDNQLTGVTDQLQQVDLQLKAMKSTPSDIRSKQHRRNLAFGPVGCTELYAPSRSLIASRNEFTDGLTNVSDTVELVNLLSPSRLECLDLAKHKYQLMCLLGHVAVVSTCCCLCPSGDEQSPTLLTSTSTVWPEELLVESVFLTSPDRVTCPSDCPAVDQLARFTIDFLGSESNCFSSASPSSLSLSCFRSRLVGMSLAEASDYVDFVLLPYLILACDLRSIYLRGHSVEFSVLKHGSESASTCLSSTSHSGGDGQTLPVARDGALSSLLLATPALKCLSDLVNSCPALDEVVPPWPMRVTVNVEHSASRSVLLVNFTMDRLAYHRPVACSTSVQVLVGQADADKIQVLLDEQEIRLGQLHQIVSLLEETLSSNRCT